METLGAIIGSRPYCASAARKKLILLMLVTEDIVSRPITVNTLEKFVGMRGWALIFCRPAYAILGAVYGEIRERPKGVPFFLSLDCRNELLMLAALAPLLQTNLETPWSVTAFSTDSSDEGYGVVQTQAKLEEIIAESRRHVSANFADGA